MKYLLFFLSSVVVNATEPIKVAIIDTGFDESKLTQINICKKGIVNDLTFGPHKNHGTNVVGLVKKHAENANYCFILINVYRKSSIIESLFTNRDYFFDIPSALLQLKSRKFDIINISAGGAAYDPKEDKLINYFLNKNIKIVVAAGNNKNRLDNNWCEYYPACLNEKLIVVGSSTGDYSNYGKIVDAYEDGTQQDGFGFVLTGTSQSTAIKTGKLVKEMSNARNKD